MILIDTALAAREAEGRPIRVALLGADFKAKAAADLVFNTSVAMRLAGIYGRKPERAFDICAYCGVKDVVSPRVSEKWISPSVMERELLLMMRFSLHARTKFTSCSM